MADKLPRAQRGKGEPGHTVPVAQPQRHRPVGRGRSMMDGWSAIDKIMPFTHAVGRVSDGKGSAILIALPEKCAPKQRRRPASRQSRGDILHNHDPKQEPIHASKQDPEAEDKNLCPMGLVLTTSFVLGDCETAMNSTVTFLEKPVAGTAIQLGREPRPFSVSVRADRRFVSSVKPKKKSKSWQDKDYSNVPDCILYSELSRMMEEDEEGEEIGYSVTYIEVDPIDDCCPSPSRTRERLDPVGDARPKPQLPLSVTRAQNATDVDGLHLIRPLPLPLLVSRIAPIKVGDAHLMVTHVNGIERSYVALKVAAVHPDFCEYENGGLLCDFSSGGAVFDMQGSFIGLQHQSGDLCIAMLTRSIVQHLFQSDLLGLCCCPISDLPAAVLQAGGISEKQRADMFNEPFSILQSSHLMDVGDKGGHLINYKDIERVRAREGGSLSASRIPSFEEVYDEFYSNSFGSLLHMLFAFWYNSPLTRKILDNIMDRKHAALHPQVATAGGIGMIMELVDGHPEDEPLVERCLAALTLLCLHSSNLSVFVQVHGILTVMESLSMYLHHPTIMQWGVHCLMCATDASQSQDASKSVELFLRANGLDLVTYALKKHGTTNRNLTSWIATLLNNVLVSNKAYVTLLHQKGLTIGVIPFIMHYSKDRLALSGLIPFFCHVVVLVRDYYQTNGPRQFQESGDPKGLTVAPSYHPFAGLPSILGQFLALATANEPLLQLFMDLCESESRACSSTGVDLLGQIADILAVFVFFKAALKPVFWGVIREAHGRVKQHLPAERVLIQKYEALLESQPSDYPPTGLPPCEEMYVGMGTFLSLPAS